MEINNAKRVRLTFKKDEIDDLIGSVATKYAIYESEELAILLEKLKRARGKFGD